MNNLVGVNEQLKKENSILFYCQAEQAISSGDADDFEDAYELLIASIEYDPENIEAWSLMASLWGGFEHDNKEDVIAYCYKRILDIEPNHREARIAMKRLVPTFFADPYVLKAAGHYRILAVRAKMGESQNNGDMQYELASALLASEPIFLGLGDDDSGFWERSDTQETSFTHATVRSGRYISHLEMVIDLGPYTERMAEAKELLNVALGLGISDSLARAKARFLLVFLSSCEAKLLPQYMVKGDSAVKSLVRDIIADVKKYLRRSPHNIEALNIQREAYRLLKNRDGEGKAKQALEQAFSLQRAGILGNEQVKQSSSETVKSRPGEALEEQVKELLRAMGLRAETTVGAADGGIDVVAYSDHPVYGGKYIVQCKDWGKPVGVSIVRDLYGVVTAERANKGILVTTGRFTKSAEQFAIGKQLELIDAERLGILLHDNV